MHTSLGQLLAEAQAVGAVRPGITAADLIVLLKGMFASLRDTTPGPIDPALRDRIFAVITDGLRPPA
jgi:hypothetical protein